MRELIRKEKALGDAIAFEILERGEYGVLSMVDVDGGAYGVPLNYVLADRKSIYFHSARVGHKIESLLNDSRVSFTVVGNSEVASEQFTSTFRSVILFGEVDCEIEKEESIAALRLLVQKYSPEHSIRGEEVIEKYIKATKVLKLNIKHIVAKENQKD